MYSTINLHIIYLKQKEQLGCYKGPTRYIGRWIGYLLATV